MSEQAQSLAADFARMNDTLIDVVERCSEDDWQAQTPAEGWSVGVTARHLADAHPQLWHLARGLADGTPLPPVTLEMNQQYTAQHAIEHADCTREETASLLRHNGSNIVRAMRELSDDQLAQSSPWTFGGGEVITVARFIERYMTDHIGAHLASMRQAIGPKA